VSAAAELLGELQARGIRMRADGGKLRYQPQAALTPDLRARVVEAKPELLRLLGVPTLDHGLAVREVLGFPATLLSQLPLPTALVVDLPGGRRATVATHPACGRADLDIATWATWSASVPGGTVAAVLAIRGATLRMVAIDGGQRP
jgi:hypothetical protein